MSLILYGEHALTHFVVSTMMVYHNLNSRPVATHLRSLAILGTAYDCPHANFELLALDGAPRMPVLRGKLRALTVQFYDVAGASGLAEAAAVCDHLESLDDMDLAGPDTLRFLCDIYG